jgi:hypothetical protein
LRQGDVCFPAAWFASADDLIFGEDIHSFRIEWAEVSNKI